MFRNPGAICQAGALSPIPVYTYATWDSGKKGANIALTGSDLIATCSVGAGVVLSTTGKSSGKWYWEITVNVSTNRGFIGVGKSTIPLDSQLGADADGFSYVDNANKRTNNSDAAYGATWAAGDIIGVYLDMDAGTLGFEKNDVDQGQAFTGLSGTFYAGWSNNLVGQVTANFGASALAYTPPSGYASGLYTVS